MSGLLIASPPSLRAAALILRDDCILLVHNEELNCYYTIGGGIEPGESSADAVIRECLEETGITFAIDRLVYVQERFYAAKDAAHHEISFFYLMAAQALPPLEGRTTDQPHERLCWVPLHALNTIHLLPPFLGQAVQSLPSQVTHIISHE